jgi:hypothetical protein
MTDGLQTAGSQDHDVEPSPSAPLDALINGALVRYTGATSAILTRLSALLRPFVIDAGQVSDKAADRSVDLDVRLEPAPIELAWQVYLNGTFLTMAYDSAYLLPYLEWLGVSRAIERSSQTVAFHAAALASERRAIILIATSGSGKTTLTSGLAGRGWQPLADDLTIVDLATRTISPFPRCFHADSYTRTVIAEAISTNTPDPTLPDYIRPERWAPAGCAPAAIILVHRDPERPASIRPATQAEAAGALFTSAIRNALPRSRVARLAVEIASEVSGCWEVNNSDLSATLDLIESAVAPR